MKDLNSIKRDNEKAKAREKAEAEPVEPDQDEINTLLTKTIVALTQHVLALEEASESLRVAVLRIINTCPECKAALAKNMAERAVPTDAN